MGKRKPASPEKLAHLNAIKKRSKIERKIEAGTATDADRAELERLPKRKGYSTGRPRGSGSSPLHGRGEVDSGQAAPHDGEQTGGADPGPPPSDSAPPPSGFPIPEPPPAVEVLPRQSGDWRSKYRQSMGREGTCVQLAIMYCGALKRMSAYVERQEGKPIFSAGQIDELVFPCAVLTADALLPADFTVTPEIELTIYSGIIAGQAASRALAAKKRGPRGTSPGQPAPRVVVPPPPPEPPPNTNGVHRDAPDPAVPTEPLPAAVKIDDDTLF